MTTVATRHVGAQPSVNKHHEVYCSTEISHKNIVIFIMVLCLMVNCHSRTVRDKGISFFRVPVIVKNQGEACEELSIERRRRWLSAISRDGLTENLIQSGRVCSQHFAQGKPAASWDKWNVDWVPTLNLGHSKKVACSNNELQI